ncbi:MAG: pilus assembly protein [Gemmatimonadota bacterium]|jgi:Flp pilus assembly protein TadG|nr:pilus assembly protein [Gemmatimonadota bacterium]
MQSIDRKCRISRAGETGAAAVEFALVAPLLVLLICGIVDLGRAYATLNQLAASAREGARLAAVLPNPEGSTQRTLVRNTVLAFSKGQLAGPDIAPGTIAVDLQASAGTVTVTVQNYPFKLITPLASVIKSEATIYISRRATFRWERAAIPPAS